MVKIRASNIKWVNRICRAAISIIATILTWFVLSKLVFVKSRQPRIKEGLSTAFGCTQDGDLQVKSSNTGYFCSCSCTIENTLAPFGAARIDNRMCPDGSVERHRFVCSFLDNMFNTREQGGRESPRRILHVAPEAPLSYYIRRRFPDADYLPGNLEITPGAVDTALVEYSVDVQKIPFPDNFFDMIVCNHVLEHVPNDTLAMSEFYRVLKSPGVAFLSAPFDPKTPFTYENHSLTTPSERLQAYGQKDHVRRYGADFIQRLEAAGFYVKPHRISSFFATHILPRDHNFKNREFELNYKEEYPVCYKG